MTNREAGSLFFLGFAEDFQLPPKQRVVCRWPTSPYHSLYPLMQCLLDQLESFIGEFRPFDSERWTGSLAWLQKNSSGKTTLLQETSKRLEEQDDALSVAPVLRRREVNRDVGDDKIIHGKIKSRERFQANHSRRDI